MLTQTAEYALRTVLHLAALEGDRPIRVDEVAETLDIPRNYLSKVMHALARTGILHSLRGPAGGFSLARPAAKITLAEVIEEFDPLDDRCLLMRRQCNDVNPCMAHHEWKGLAVRLRTFFRETTVEQLVQGAARTSPGGVVVVAPEGR